MDKALQTMINNMPEKTGKSLEEWIKILIKEDFSKHSQAVSFLKQEHSVTHGFANTIVSLSKDKGDSSEDLVAAQYTGKESLRPIFEQLIKSVKKFGSDVVIAPKKTSVSLIRKKQFALIKPATKSRIDLGLKFKDRALTDRLENSGPFGTMCTHRVRIENITDIDEELIGWLTDAYNESV